MNFKNLTLHPLLNPNSTHYRNDGKQDVIATIEQNSTLCECMGWAKNNILKYQKRDKGQDELDNQKIKDYQNYLDLLHYVVNVERVDRGVNAYQTITACCPNMKYALN